MLNGQASEWALLKRHESEDIFGVQLAGAYADTMTKACQLINENCKVVKNYLKIKSKYSISKSQLN